MICLDTCFIIDLLRGVGEAEKKAREIDDSEDPAISVISVYELWVGVGTLGVKARRDWSSKLEEILDRLHVLDLDLDAAEEAAKIMLDLRAGGKPIEQNDSFIAGSCISKGVKKLLTRNTRHFSGIKGLKVESY